MGYSHKFLCCIPVRLGVLIMTIFGLLAGGAVSILGWVAIKNLHDHPDQRNNLSSQQRTSLIIQTLLYTVLAFLSLFGFLGAVQRKRSFVSAYAQALWIHWGLNVGTGAFFLYHLFKNEVPGAPDESKSVKEATAAVLVVIWLLELYGCVIASSYVSQLDEEEAMHSPTTNVVIQSGPPAMYQPGPPTTYGFSAPQNAYGMNHA